MNLRNSIPTIDKFTGIKLSTIKDSPKEKTPCDHCKFDLDCKRNEIACLDFAHYIETGNVREKSRYPTRQIRLKIFPHERTQMEKTEVIVINKKETQLVGDLKLKSLTAMDMFLDGK